MVFLLISDYYSVYFQKVGMLEYRLFLTYEFNYINLTLLSILFCILLCYILSFSFCQYRLFPYTMPICLVANPLHITHRSSHTNWPTSSQEVSSSPSQYSRSSRRASHPSSGFICLVLELRSSDRTTSGYSHLYWCSSAWWSSSSEQAGQSHGSSVSYYSGSRPHRYSVGMHTQRSDTSTYMHSSTDSWGPRVPWSRWSSSGSSPSISRSASRIEPYWAKSENPYRASAICEIWSSHQMTRI